ncbi:MAG: tRNA lysidine(34) synthetase TilS [Ruminococcus sp.]|nr:tRNA lysidine(34) synthetase TilS [Ruminococcus sp.]
MKKVIEYIKKNGMITTEDRVIAGISGGADSVCLFFVLLELRERFGTDFIAVHINHGLRGEAADEDEQFVRSLCEKYGVKLEVFRKDVVSISRKRKESFEETGRWVRREAFEEVMQKYGGTKIALAHHQNDNAETFLMNLARGTGLRGLTGIRPVNGVYIRPLLCMSRKEIEEFLAKRGESFCEDETNKDTKYTRNSLRHLVIPMLEEKVNVQAVRHMNETMEQLCELEAYMEEQTERAWEQCVTKEETKKLLVNKETFETYPPILQKMLLRRCMAWLDGGLKDIGQIHIRQIVELFQKQNGRRIDLPGNAEAIRQYEGVCIRKKAEKKDGQEPENAAEDLLEGMTKITIPGKTKIPGTNLAITCKLFPRDDKFSIQNIPQKNYTKWFEYDIIESSLCVRTKKAGDRIEIKKGQSKKLKSWFINEKIPAEERGRVLLLADGEQIMWIIGHRMSAGYQITDQTQQILQVEITEEKENGRQD